MNLNDYIKNIQKRFSAGISTEHSYRADLQVLISELIKGVLVTNEPKRQECGAPDYIIQKKDVPIGYIEAKDMGIDLDKTEKSEQLKRYLTSLDNLILTDYIEFRFYRFGEKTKTIKLGEIEKNKIKIFQENFEEFILMLTDFCSFSGQTIKSGKKLAKIMAQKARLMKNVIYNVVMQESENNTLKNQLEGFRKVLIANLGEPAFADIYAQTIAYGLFAARLNDKTLEDFSRQETLFLVPKSNPFLRQLFSYVAGPELDDRVVWIVNDLADVFRATDVKEIMSDFGKTTQQNDPFLHFYETFLGEYDQSLRKAKGVYYTPEPVVNFIIRAVDDILKNDFKINDGLADISKTEITTNDLGKKIKEKVHRVQILDPAAGTGTFLAEVVKEISKKFETQKGMWSRYVENDLIPRLNGFEILMAPYTMCHLKLDMLLRETGYKPKDENKQQRLRVFLTNSLEDAHSETGTLFASWLANEANEANLVKKETPVMVIIGNPPYSVSSVNKSKWIQNLINDYKKDLKERKINLDDDYIKFIRFGQYFIDKNKEGILAFISNNSFIDGITHRQMRKILLESFDKIYILDLHGNSKKKECCPDGSIDQNVFDIMQGVSINIFVKTNQKKKNELGKVFHYDLQGKRELKYDYLNENSINSLNLKQLNSNKPNFFFVPKNFDDIKEYEKGFKINDLFGENVAGIETIRDAITIHFNNETLKKVVNDFLNLDQTEIAKKYNTVDARDWKIGRAKEDIKLNINNINAWQNINYRPFDIRKTFYTGKQNGFVCNGRYNVMKHLLKSNFGLIIKRGFDEKKSAPVFISKYIIDRRSWSRPGMQGAESIFPLYVYNDINEQIEIWQREERTPNLRIEIVNKICENLDLTYTNEKEETKNTFAPIDIFDYIYAVLHSLIFREKYKEFLKIDFPRVPYPKNKKSFYDLVKFGSELREFHLLEHSSLTKYITEYPVDGDNTITRSIAKKDFEIIDTKKMLGRVWINDIQYFDKIPLVAFDYYIGGYQPAQKWLKDRKGLELTNDDISHYQKIIISLFETDRLVKEIDKIIEI